MPGAAAPQPSMAAAPMEAPAAPPPPPAKKGPPPGLTLEASDLSKVPGEFAPVARAFVSLYQSVLPLAVNAIKKKEMEDNSKKLAALVWRLSNGEVGPALAPKLQQFAGALERGDLATAGQLQHELTSTMWEENKDWLMATKRLLKSRESGH
jgi:protein transport protein SEC31